MDRSVASAPHPQIAAKPFHRSAWKTAEMLVNDLPLAIFASEDRRSAARPFESLVIDLRFPAEAICAACNCVTQTNAFELFQCEIAPNEDPDHIHHNDLKSIRNWQTKWLPVRCKCVRPLGGINLDKSVGTARLKPGSCFGANSHLVVQ